MAARRHPLRDEIEAITPTWGEHWSGLPRALVPYEDTQPDIPTTSYGTPTGRGEGISRIRGELASGEWMTAREIVEATGLAARVVSSTLWGMRQCGEVESREVARGSSRTGDPLQWRKV